MPLIVFEGLDGSGKSTLVVKLRESLQARGMDPVLIRDPGTTEIGEKIRNIILDTNGQSPCAKSETLLYGAARAQMVKKRILPALGQSKWVLCDRFYSSTVAFQCFGRGLDLENIEFINRFAIGDCEPDLFIFLDISVEESQRRKLKRLEEKGLSQDRMELEDFSFQDRVRQGYRYQAKKNPRCWFCLDGTLSPEILLRKVLEELEARKWLD